MANAQIARQQLITAQQRVAQQRQSLEAQRKRVAETRVPALTRSQLRTQTQISAARYRGQEQQLAAQKSQALQQIKKATEKVVTYETQVVKPFESRVIGAEAFEAEQKAYKSALKFVEAGIPTRYVSPLEKKYMKKIIFSKQSAQAEYYKGVREFQEQYPGEKLIFEQKEFAPTGKIIGIESGALGVSVPIGQYGGALEQYQAPDIQTMGLSPSQQLGITLPQALGVVTPPVFTAPPVQPQPYVITAAPSQTFGQRFRSFFQESGLRDPITGFKETVIKDIPEVGPAIGRGIEAGAIGGIEALKPVVGKVLELPIVEKVMEMPAERLVDLPPIVGIGPIGFGPSVRDLPPTGVKVEEVVEFPSRALGFISEMAGKGAEISYQETIAKLPPEWQPSKIIPGKEEEYKMLVEDIRMGEIKLEDISFEGIVTPITSEAFGKGVETGVGIGGYIGAGVAGVLPLLLASDVEAARQDYRDAPELAKKEAEKSYKDYLKTDLEEGEDYVSKEEYMNTVVPQFETEIRNQAMMAAGISGGFLVGGALWKVGSTLKKYVPRKKFTFGGRKLSQAKYDKLMRQIEQSRISVAKQEADIFKIREERELLVPQTTSELFGKGVSKEVVSSVEKLTLADDLFNLKVFKTETEAIKFVEGMTKTRTGIKQVFPTELKLRVGTLADIEKVAKLPKVGKEWVTGADSFTLSRSLRTKGVDKIVQFSYQLGAEGKPINIGLQIIKVPKGSKYAELMFYKAGRSSVKTIKKDGLIFKEEVRGPYILTDKLVADIGKVRVGKIDETFLRLSIQDLRRVKFKKARVLQYELADDWYKIPTKGKLKELFEAGRKVEKQVIIEKISPIRVEAKLGLIDRRDVLSVGAKVERVYDVELLGVGRKEAELIKIPKWFKETLPKPKGPKTPFSVTFPDTTGPQILTTKQVTALKLPLPTLISPLKVKIPTTKITPPPTELLGKGLPYMVGGLGLKEVIGAGVKLPARIIDQIELAPEKIREMDLAPTKVGEVSWISEVPRMGLGVGVGVGLGIESALELKPALKLESTTMMFQPLEIKPVVKMAPRVVQVPKVTQVVRVAQVPRLKMAQVLELVPAVSVTPSVAVRQRQRQRPKPKIKPISFRIPLKRVRRFPPKKKALPKKGYGIEIKRRGVWERVKIPYAFATEEGAKAVMMEKLLKGAIASGRLVKSFKPVRRTLKRPTASQKIMFRPGKEKGVIVQKKLLRITSPGEVREISLVGAAARRGVSTWGLGKLAKKKKKVKKKVKKKSKRKK